MNSFLKKFPSITFFLSAFITGALSVLSLPPYNHFIVFLLGFSAIIYLVKMSETRKQTFLICWAYGFGYFTFGLYWIANALFIDIAKWWWLVPPTLLGLPFALSFFWGLAGILAHKFKHNDISLAFSISAAFGLSEFLRGYLFTGFPWNLPAYIWINSPVSQSLSLIGAYGLSLLTFLIGTTAFLILRYKQTKSKPIMYSALFSIAILWGLCACGITRTPNTPSAASDKKYALIQPNIEQKDKWKPDKQWHNLNALSALTKKAAKDAPDIFIWPETAITFPKDELSVFTPLLEEALTPHQTLISGIIDVSTSDTDGENYFNSLIVLDHKGTIQTQYDKHHLVPFGEYVPFRDILSFGPVAQALSTTGDFSAGSGLKTLYTMSTSFSPLICYEVIFPGKSVSTSMDRPEFILNLTNDAWYGDTTGPRQHLAMSQARAIETGLPLLRSAGTGISAAIDPYGRIISSIPLNQSGYTSGYLPRPLPSTLYLKYGEKLFGLIWLFFVGIALLHRKKTV